MNTLTEYELSVSTSRRIRTRVAPSPTGDPHVGTAYVALANYAFAKRYGGDFILRIEDTDQQRSTLESESAILRALRWSGLSWSEGPDVGGPYGPYRQSERSDIYKHFANLLLEAGKAFRCFCTPNRLETMRATQRAAGVPQKYDGTCLKYSPAVAAQRAAERQPFVVRMKVPDSGLCTVKDLVRGDVFFEYGSIDMQVLLKSDGLPTYHLANVVDDHLMMITHVIRGEEWLSSAPKHLLLYEYLGWEAPYLIHLPLLRNQDKSKLSKRKNPTGILFYKGMGYLPEALMNALSLLLSPLHHDETEIFSIDELSQRLDLRRISPAGPVFDAKKLDWLNGIYLRSCDTSELIKKIEAWAFEPTRIRHIVEMAKTRIERLSDLGDVAAFLFSGRLRVTEADFAKSKLSKDDIRKTLACLMWELDTLPSYSLEAIDHSVDRVVESLGYGSREINRVYYIAITGSPTSLPLYQSMELLGRDIVRERLRTALALYTPVTAKEQRTWQAEVLRNRELPE